MLYTYLDALAFGNVASWFSCFLFLLISSFFLSFPFCSLLFLVVPMVTIRLNLCHGDGFEPARLSRRVETLQLPLAQLIDQTSANGVAQDVDGSSESKQ